MLDVKRLRILREVAQHGSFSAAADELYLSQSAVSQQIATLEREVGMKLLDRTREGPKLTDAGRVLVSHAEAAIARLDEAERELAAIAGLEGGELRLASFPSASATVLTEAVSVFHRAPSDGPAQRHRRRARGVAAAAARRRDRPRAHLRLPVGAVAEERDLDRTLVLTESMHVALPEDHPLAEPRGRPARGARRPRVALRLAPEHLRRRSSQRLPRRRLRAAASASSPTTTTSCRASSRPGSASPCCPTSRCRPARRPRRPRHRSAGARAPRLGGDPRRGVSLAGDREMVSILVEVGDRSPPAARERLAARRLAAAG